ncbi:hypothetical protein PMAYCL1PPCAC_10978, partial [Pristionchus mayeri]
SVISSREEGKVFVGDLERIDGENDEIDEEEHTGDSEGDAEEREDDDGIFAQFGMLEVSSGEDHNEEGEQSVDEDEDRFEFDQNESVNG